MIDLRWGVTRDIELTNITTQLCINEVKKCLNESIGPAFIVRYGI